MVFFSEFPRGEIVLNLGAVLVKISVITVNLPNLPNLFVGKSSNPKRRKTTEK